ncbi:MAG TPA: TolC family protein [Polyangiaceae bacterium]|jgi:outer membrane protein TolC
MRAGKAAWFLWAMLTAAAPPAAAQATGNQTSGAYSLHRCLDLAERNYPKILQARARLAKQTGQLREAKTAPYSDFTLSAGLTAAPTVRGTDVYSPNTDSSLSSDMGLAWQIGIEGAVPLWTFGKISGLQDAAEAQVEAGKHGVKKERNEVRLLVRRAYYGLQLARDSLALVKNAEQRILTHLTRLEERAQRGQGDDIQLLKVKMYQAELQARESEIQHQESTALSGLRFLTGVSNAFDIPDEPLRRSRHTLAPLAHYLSAARLFRPEVNMARAGVVAREAQLRMARARYYPDLALGLSAKWARADQVTDQRNPFVEDRANFLQYGAGLVLRWKLDFLPQAARTAQAEADLEEMRAEEQYALGGVGVEVEEAFSEARTSEKRVEALSRAAKYARQWLVKVQQGIDVGTFDDEDIVDPAKEYALKRFAQMSAIFDYNIAVAKLAQATGWDAVVAE